MLDQTYIAPDEQRLLARFWQSASGFWRGRSAWRAWLLVTLLIATVLLFCVGLLSFGSTIAG
jgi:putative ATP-binding cassette transporter